MIFMDGLIYSTLQVSYEIDVQPSTVRKYALALEKADYEFQRNSAGHRIYMEHDIKAFADLVRMTKEEGLSVANGAVAIVTGKMPSVTPEHDVDIEQHIVLDRQKFENFKQEQDIFNQALMQRLDEQDRLIEKQQEYIEERLKERDQRLLETLNESKNKKTKKGLFTRMLKNK